MGNARPRRFPALTVPAAVRPGADLICVIWMLGGMEWMTS